MYEVKPALFGRLPLGEYDYPFTTQHVVAHDLDQVLFLVTGLMRRGRWCALTPLADTDASYGDSEWQLDYRIRDVNLVQWLLDIYGNLQGEL